MEASCCTWSRWRPSCASDWRSPRARPSEESAAGTLTSLTTGILWNRQKDIRESLNKEANILDMLITSCGKLFAGDPPRHLKALAVTRDYLYCVAGESSPSLSIAEKERIFDQTNRKSLALYEICVLDVSDSSMLDADFTFGSPDRARRIIDGIKGLIEQLNDTRARRRTLVETGFPFGHYALLLSLEACILSAFFLQSTATASAAFFFALKPRTIISIVAAIFTAIPALLYDLDDPFSGQYQIGNTLTITSTVSLLLEEKQRALRREALLAEKSRIPQKEIQSMGRFQDSAVEPFSDVKLTTSARKRRSGLFAFLPRK
eukprot:scaffold754_cov248-Pinguiococcus_pyrenoidosus.AAC.51